MTNAEIDFATIADLSPLADLLAELFTQESDFFPDREKQLSGLRTILSEPVLGRLFVLRVNGNVAGMANALITVSTAEGGRVLILEDVIIGRAFRGKGMGKQLVEAVLRWAEAEGMRRVTLLTDNDNSAAQHLYRKLGFVTSDMQVMRKYLG
ncbi:MAG: GNAT family N-acetyltransferase [Gallionella sp.]